MISTSLGVTTRRLLLHLLISAAIIVGSSVGGAEPQPADPLTTAVGQVVAQAKRKPAVVLVVLRPDERSDGERLSVVDAVVTRVVACLKDKGLDAHASAAADAVLRNSAVVGVAGANQLSKLRAADKFDAVLSVSLARAGEKRTLRMVLFDDTGGLSRAEAVLQGTSSLTTPTTLGVEDWQAAERIISEAMKKPLEDARAAAIQQQCTVAWIATAAEKPLAESTPHLERELRDRATALLAEAGVQVQQLPASPSASPSPVALARPLKPADLAKLTTLKPGQAVVSITHARRGPVHELQVSLLTSKAVVFHATAVLDRWAVFNLPEVPLLNAGVLKYAQDQLGQKVGNGECWTLAAEALKSAAAREARGYDFGRPLAKGEPVLAGDIIQFTDCRFEWPGGWRQMGAPNHTAIVKGVLGETEMELLQQNPGPVATAKIDFKRLTKGEYKIFRPLPR